MGSKIYKIDVRRTKELKLPELLVLADRGDREHFYCVPNPEKVRVSCPHCGDTSVRIQGILHRNYLDAILREDESAIITVSLEFNKYRCTAPDCGCVFQPQFSFAAPYMRMTRRVADAIIKMVDVGMPYSEIAEELKKRISRQAVGQIYHRRVKELEDDTSEEAAWVRELMRKKFRERSLTFCLQKY